MGLTAIEPSPSSLERRFRAGPLGSWRGGTVVSFHDVTGHLKESRLPARSAYASIDRGEWQAMDGQWRDLGHGVVLTFALVATAGAAHGADWQVTPGAGIEQAFSDNVDLDRKGEEESDLSTALTASVGVVGTGRHLSLNLNYSISRVTFWSSSDRDEFRHNLTSSAQSELLDDFLFFDSQASVREQFIDNTQGVSGSSANSSENRDTVASLNTSPFIRFRLEDFADATLRYRYNTTLVGQSNDSDTHTASFNLDDGLVTTNLGWALRLEHSKQISSGNDPSDRRSTADLNFDYAINQQFSLLSGVGYEDIEDGNLADNPKGVTWNVGFDYSPSRRANLRATYGRRFDDDNVNVSASWRPSSRTDFVMTFAQTLDNSSRRLSSALGNLFVDENGDFIDDVTGLPFDPTEPGLSFDNETVRQDALTLALNATRGRSRFGLRGFLTERSSDVDQTDELVTGGSATWSRTLSRTTTGNLSLSYRNTDFDTADGREDDQYTAALNFTYRLSPDLTTALSYDYTLRDSTIGTNDLEENAVSIRLNKTF